MGKKIANKTTQFTSPGPCAYTPRLGTRSTTPSWSIHGTKGRSNYKNNHVPGPGAYDLNESVNYINIIVTWIKI